MNAGDVQQVGKWQVVRLIGQGGMSWVFEVVDPHLGARRALKMLKPVAASTAGYKGFWREARILASLDDDFLVRIYDLDKDPATGNDYYVMELLSGSDLKQFLRTQGPLDEWTARSVFGGVLQALGKLHAQSPPIIHRDIKPGNIQITESGRAKLLDLGIAKVTRGDSAETVFDADTVADMFKGTVLYASPEQLAMQDSGPPADVFSMGLCLYEAIEGRHVYAGMEGLPDPTSAQVLYQDVFRFYTRLETLEGSLKIDFKRTSKALRPVIRKALEIDPRRRFRDANAMRDALLNPESVSASSTVTERASARARPTQRRDEQAEASREPVRPVASRAAGLKIALALVLVSAIGGAAYWIATRGGGPEATTEQAAEKRAAELAIDEAVRSVSTEAAVALAREARALQREGDLAWQAQDFAGAAAKYAAAGAEARAAIESDAQPLPPPPPVAFAVTVAPAGPIELEVGGEQRLRAAPNRPGAIVRFTVEPPGGARPTESVGEDYDFRPQRAGEYRIRVNASDAEGAQAEPVLIAATVLAARRQEVAPNDSEVTKPNRAPEISLATEGTIAARVGDSVELRAFAKDADGGQPEVRFTVSKPSGAGAIPSALQELGNARVLRFTPATPGTYAFSFWARDAAGAESSRRSVRLEVAPAREKAEGESGTETARLAEGRTLLQRFRRAIMNRDMNGLRSVWKIDPETAQGFQHLFDNADDITVVADALGPIEASGDRGRLRFRQRVTVVIAGETQDIVPLAPYRADLLRQGSDWRIVGLEQE